jgi:hypothetical protein
MSIGEGEVAANSMSCGVPKAPPRHGSFRRNFGRSLSLKEAVIELVHHSFIPEVVSSVGLEAQRFGFFAKLLQKVSMCRLTYPSGVAYLPEVRQAILRDLAHL